MSQIQSESGSWLLKPFKATMLLTHRSLRFLSWVIGELLWRNEKKLIHHLFSNLFDIVSLISMKISYDIKNSV